MEKNVYLVSGATNNPKKSPYFSVIYSIDQKLNGSKLISEIANSVQKELGNNTFSILNIINLSTVNG